jgi:hypothetical protein
VSRLRDFHTNGHDSRAAPDDESHDRFPLFPNPSPARGEGRFVSRLRDFHTKLRACPFSTAPAADRHAPLLSQPSTPNCPGSGPTIFTVMSKLAADCGAINLSQGFPDFRPIRRSSTPLCGPCAPGAISTRRWLELPELRAAIADKVAALYGADLRRRERNHRHRRRHAGDLHGHRRFRSQRRRGDRFRAGLRQLCAGDRNRRRQGGLRVAARFPTTGRTGSRSAALLSPRTRMIIINSPHNPSGSLFDADDLATAGGT